jgi:hypothetical protein
MCNSQGGDGDNKKDLKMLVSQRSARSESGVSLGLGDRLFAMAASSSTEQNSQAAHARLRLSTSSSSSSQNQPFYDSETEIITALQELSQDASYPEVYQRCAKVLVKIANLNQAKNFFWEVDSVMFPDYYSTIVRPIMIMNIAGSLVAKAYGRGDDDNGQDKDTDTGDKDAFKNENGNENGTSSTSTNRRSGYNAVARAFYRDTRQVLVNCFTYNTEITTIVAQAQKVFQALWRHSKRWLLDPADELPPLSFCDESHCLLSLNSVSTQSNIKCGRCCGVFSIDDLYEISNSTGSGSGCSTLSVSLSSPIKKSTALSVSPYIIMPSEEVRSQANEEWFCPLCLQEDTSATSAEEAFFLDEWGPSGLLPWMFNPAHSRYASVLGSSDLSSRDREIVDTDYMSQNIVTGDSMVVVSANSNRGTETSAGSSGSSGSSSSSSVDPNPSLRRMLEAALVLSIPRKSSTVHLDREITPLEVLDGIDYSKLHIPCPFSPFPLFPFPFPSLFLFPFPFPLFSLFYSSESDFYSTKV